MENVTVDELLGVDIKFLGSDKKEYAYVLSDLKNHKESSINITSDTHKYSYGHKHLIDIHIGCDSFNYKIKEFEKENTKVNNQKNCVRFFCNSKEEVLKEYENILIPYIGSTVYIYDEPYIVTDITYDFDDGKDGFSLIDVHTKKRSVIADEDMGDYVDDNSLS